ncbi:hypothetical protein M0802_011038 [Mischocyttarus mexicanus]|nr:hypothetical protein M0802_011038 [Mischocyttarus mexicanus]
MLKTTIHSPQHKRVLQMEINRRNDLQSSDINRTLNSNEDLIKIRKAKEIHLELIKCARNTNDAYGLHILSSLSAAFTLITVITYNIYYILIIKEIKTQVVQMITFMFWLLYFGLKIITLSHISSDTATEIRDFTLQIIQNPLSFTTCGYFDLDYTLISNVIGTVTTYLVILIQIGPTPSIIDVKNSTLSTNDM